MLCFIPALLLCDGPAGHQQPRAHPRGHRFSQAPLPRPSDGLPCPWPDALGSGIFQQALLCPRVSPSRRQVLAFLRVPA